MNIITATQSLGSSKVYIMPKQEYVRQTVENMREDVLNRAKQTLKALKDYEGGKLESPMARSGLNCIKIKIGYGARNSQLFTYEDGKNFRRCNGATVKERRKVAMLFLRTAIDSIKLGGIDEYLEAYLKTRQSNSKEGAKARSAQSLRAVA